MGLMSQRPVHIPIAPPRAGPSPSVPVAPIAGTAPVGPVKVGRGRLDAVLKAGESARKAEEGKK